MNAALLIARVGSQQGLTQAQIAGRVGAHPDHVAAWSRGEDCPPEKHRLLQQLAESKQPEGQQANPDDA